MLKQELKVTLSYPNISSSFSHSLKKISKRLNKNFPFKSRKKWLKVLKEKSGNFCSKLDNWSYENKNQVFGTFLFDDFFFNRKFKGDIIKSLSLNKNNRIKYFVDFWLKFYKDL